MKRAKKLVPGFYKSETFKDLRQFAKDRGSNKIKEKYYPGWTTQYFQKLLDIVERS